MRVTDTDNNGSIGFYELRQQRIDQGYARDDRVYAIYVDSPLPLGIECGIGCMLYEQAVVDAPEWNGSMPHEIVHTLGYSHAMPTGRLDAIPHEKDWFTMLDESGGGRSTGIQHCGQRRELGAAGSIPIDTAVIDCMKNNFYSPEGYVAGYNPDWVGINGRFFNIAHQSGLLTPLVVKNDPVVCRGVTAFYGKEWGMTISGQTAVAAGEGNDSVTGTSNADKLCGGDGGDSLYGSTSADTLDGNGGLDKLYGQGGNDVIYDGMGGDYIDGGAGTDTLYMCYDDVNDDYVNIEKVHAPGSAYCSNTNW